MYKMRSRSLRHRMEHGTRIPRGFSIMKQNYELFQRGTNSYGIGPMASSAAVSIDARRFVGLLMVWIEPLQSNTEFVADQEAPHYLQPGSWLQ